MTRPARNGKNAAGVTQQNNGFVMPAAARDGTIRAEASYDPVDVRRVVRAREELAQAERHHATLKLDLAASRLDVTLKKAELFEALRELRTINPDEVP